MEPPKDGNSNMPSTNENNLTQSSEHNSFSSHDKRHKLWVVVCLASAYFWTGACISLQAPFLSREAESKSASLTVYGFIFAIFQLSCIISSPIYAKMMPPIKPKFLAVLGCLTEGMACIAFGLLDFIPPGTTFIALAFLLRILEGAAAAATAVAGFSITSIVFANNVAKAFSLLEITYGLGLIAGPAIGGLLYEAGGFPLPFSVCGILLLITGLFLTCGMPTKEKVEDGTAMDFKRFLLNWDLILCTVGAVTAMAIISYNEATLEPHIRVFNLRPSILSLVFIVPGILYSGTTPLWGALIDKGADPHKICIIGYFLNCIGLFFIGPSPLLSIPLTLWLTIICLVIIGVGISANVVAAFVGGLQSAKKRGYPDTLSTYSAVSSVFTSGWFLGSFIGPSIGGYFLDTIGYENGTMIVLGCELLLFIIETVRAVIKWKDARNKVSERTALLYKTSERRIEN